MDDDDDDDDDDFVCISYIPINVQTHFCVTVHDLIVISILDVIMKKYGHFYFFFTVHYDIITQYKPTKRTIFIN
jgi:hypothetical protein